MLFLERCVVHTEEVSGTKMQPVQLVPHSSMYVCTSSVIHTSELLHLHTDNIIINKKGEVGIVGRARERGGQSHIKSP